MTFMGNDHTPGTHVTNLMHVSKLMRAESPLDQRANWIDDAVNFLERETKLAPSALRIENPPS